MFTLPTWIALLPLGAFALVGALAWMANRRKLALATNDRDVKMALLSSVRSGEQMTGFLGSPEGRRFMDQLTKGKETDPRRQVIEHLQGGVVTLLIGVALTTVARLGLAVLAIPGFICLGVGLALLISACISYPMTKRLGLVAAQSADRA
jgi:hypothetical protein